MSQKSETRTLPVPVSVSMKYEQRKPQDKDSNCSCGVRSSTVETVLFIMSTRFSTPEMNAMDRKPSGGGALDADDKFRLRSGGSRVKDP